MLHCEVDDNGTFHTATILRSKVSPMDVVIWFDGSEQYEGLGGGYRFDGALLHDPDGDVIAWRVASSRSPAGQSVRPAMIKLEPGTTTPEVTPRANAAPLAGGLLLLYAHASAD